MIATLRQRFAGSGLTGSVNTRIAPLRARYDALQPREQTLVNVAAVLLIAALLYSAVWQPFARGRKQLALDLASARSVATQLAQAEVDVRLAAPQSAPIVGSDVSLLTAVDQAAKNGTLKKPPARLQPDGENAARIWLEDVEFETLLRWMLELQTRYGVTIDVVDIEKRETAGLVNARLSVLRAP
ncbi:type II secretion system protein M [Nevskia sp.]|uniref:type II secretion system protein M n=1 Tax=Nevskia sp. TaxID=1929292 RepID=UPI0025D210F5|nr:type II secretion system protein M [Nevskia sp.]